MAVPTVGHLISDDIISGSAKKIQKSASNSSAILWKMLRTVPSLLPQTCFKDVKQPAERLGTGVNTSKFIKRYKFFQTSIFSILREAGKGGS